MAMLDLEKQLKDEDKACCTKSENKLKDQIEDLNKEKIKIHREIKELSRKKGT